MQTNLDSTAMSEPSHLTDLQFKCFGWIRIPINFHPGLRDARIDGKKWSTLDELSQRGPYGLVNSQLPGKV